jgi:hypothetical protein
MALLPAPCDEAGVRNAVRFAPKAPSGVFTLRDVRSDGAGHPALEPQQRILRLAAAFFAAQERLWPALSAPPVIQLVNTKPITPSRARFCIDGTRGSVGRYGCTAWWSDALVRWRIADWIRISTPSLWRYRCGCWRWPLVPACAWLKLRSLIAPPCSG